MPSTNYSTWHSHYDGSPRPFIPLRPQSGREVIGDLLSWTNAGSRRVEVTLLPEFPSLAKQGPPDPLVLPLHSTTQAVHTCTRLPGLLSTSPTTAPQPSTLHYAAPAGNERQEVPTELSWRQRS